MSAVDIKTLNRAIKVFKYEIQQHLGSAPTIRVPQGTIFLHADQIDGKIFVWARVPVGVEGKAIKQYEYDRKIAFFLTGDEIPPNWVYVDTVVIKPGGGVADETQIEVLHVFDGLRDS
jgi:hypothetical protein